MAEEQRQHADHNLSMTVKVSAKGEAHGEFTARGDSIEEIRQRVEEMKGLFFQQIR